MYHLNCQTLVKLCLWAPALMYKKFVKFLVLFFKSIFHHFKFDWFSTHTHTGCYKTHWHRRETWKRNKLLGRCCALFMVFHISFSFLYSFFISSMFSCLTKDYFLRTHLRHKWLFLYRHFGLNLFFNKNFFEMFLRVSSFKFIIFE